MTGTEFLSVKEVSEYLRVHRTTVLKWIKQRKLTAYKPGGRVLRVKKVDVERMLDSARKVADDKIMVTDREVGRSYRDP